MRRQAARCRSAGDCRRMCGLGRIMGVDMCLCTSYLTVLVLVFFFTLYPCDMSVKLHSCTVALRTACTAFAVVFLSILILTCSLAAPGNVAARPKSQCQKTGPLLQPATLHKVDDTCDRVALTCSSWSYRVQSTGTHGEHQPLVP